MSAFSNVSSKLADGVLKFFSKVDGADMMILEPTSGRVINEEMCYQGRFHVAVADIADATGATLLAALPGYKYRIVDALAIAVGGAVTAVTTVDLVGTQTSAVKLVAWGQAALTQSTVVRAGGAGGTVLADGASFAVCDENTAITLGRTGAAITVATHVDVILHYAIEPAG